MMDGYSYSWLSFDQMKRMFLRLGAILFLLFFGFRPNQAAAYQETGGRKISLTLIPNYVDQSIRFDGSIEFGSAFTNPNPSGLPLLIEHDWMDINNNWNFLGVVEGGRIEFDQEDEMYHLILGPVTLEPGDQIGFILPFVNLDYDQIDPLPDEPDRGELTLRQLSNRFSFRAGDAPREIRKIDIPFKPITRQIDLILTPLIGESLVLDQGSFRLSGKAHFGAITNFIEFGRFCQNTTSRIRYGDYRVANLLTMLDTPTYSGFNGLNPVYQFKPTTVALRSELINCQFDRDEGIGQVEATFSGRVFGLGQGSHLFPDELRSTDFVDGNFPFSPTILFKGVQGYEIRLGRILLRPGDVLNIRVPRVQIQADSLDPPPNNIVNLDPEGTGSGLQLTYFGPAEFELFLPYVPQTELYGGQFPAILRPSAMVVESRVGSLSLNSRSYAAWGILAAGLFLLLLSRYIKASLWFALPGWVLISISLYFGLRGSFGLLCLAVFVWLGQFLKWGTASKNRLDTLKRIGLALLALFVIALAMSFDRDGTEIFRGLSTSDLSPLTPLILIGTIVLLLLVLYFRKLKDMEAFHAPDLPVLILLLSVLCLYDAFDKSLLALFILLVGGWYLSRRQRAGETDTFGKDLRKRFQLAFHNRLILFSILILILFALGKDLSSTFANEIHISVAPYLAPLVIPLLAVVSVSVSFISIALLFVLIYPYLPTETGYIKASLFALFLFLVFLFGIGTDDRLIASLPSILVGRVIYYFSVPMLIGISFDINDFMARENERLAQENKENESIGFTAAGRLYFKNLQGLVGTLTGILSLVAPSLYAYLASQPVFVTYFSLLEKLVLLPI